MDPTTGKISNSYMEVLKTVAHSGGSTGGTFGPVVTTAKVGEVLTNMALNGVFGTTVGPNVVASDQIGAAFLFFSEWDYFGSATVSAWTAGNCYVLSYVLYQTNYAAFLTGTAFTYSYKRMKGVTCFADSAGASTAALVVSESTLPTKWGLKYPGWGGASTAAGVLVKHAAAGNGVNSEIVSGGVVLPPMVGPNLQKTIGRWVIPLPVSL